MAQHKHTQVVDFSNPNADKIKSASTTINMEQQTKKMPEFDGEYLCQLQITQECGNVWIRWRVRECSMNKWILESNEKVVWWQSLPISI